MTIFPRQWETQQSPGTATCRRAAPFVSVVGFDGTAHAMQALDSAVAQLHGREGSIELVYVADPLVGTRKISDQARAQLLPREPRWHFQRGDGIDVPDELVAAADRLRQYHGSDANIAIVVGSSTEHGDRVARALIHRYRYPIVVVP
jgi:hypothetical protein